MIMVISLDGLVTLKDNPEVSSWTSNEDKIHLKRILVNFDAVITGRKSFYGKIVEKPYYILTRKKYDDDNKNEIFFVKGNPKEIIKKINSRGEEKIALLGGPETNYIFLKENLVDELYITIEPKLLGEGKSLNVGKELNLDLQLLSVKTMNKRGTLLTHYKVMK